MNSKTNVMQYPECDKVKKIAPFSQKIGEFLDWLNFKKRVYLAEDFPYEEGYGYGSYTAHCPIPKKQLLAEFFDIDLNKWEEEKRVIFENCRN